MGTRIRTLAPHPTPVHGRRRADAARAPSPSIWRTTVSTSPTDRAAVRHSSGGFRYVKAMDRARGPWIGKVSMKLTNSKNTNLQGVRSGQPRSVPLCVACWRARSFVCPRQPQSAPQIFFSSTVPRRPGARKKLRDQSDVTSGTRVERGRARAQRRVHAGSTESESRCPLGPALRAGTGSRGGGSKRDRRMALW